MNRVLRHEIPIDSRPHTLRLGGDPIAADGYRPGGLSVNTLEFWCVSDDASYSVMYQLQVFGTGEPVPDGARWLCSTGRLPNGEVWHLFDMEPDHSAIKQRAQQKVAELTTGPVRTFPFVTELEFPDGLLCSACGRNMTPGQPYKGRSDRWTEDVPADRLTCVYC